MKFYREKKFDLLHKIKFNKLTATINNNNPTNYRNSVYFFKNGMRHNYKNASFISWSGDKSFCLNGKYYGDQNDFTKKSWRRFVKMKVFL